MNSFDDFLADQLDRIAAMPIRLSHRSHQGLETPIVTRKQVMLEIGHDGFAADKLLNPCKGAVCEVEVRR